MHTIARKATLPRSITDTAKRENRRTDIMTSEIGKSRGTACGLARGVVRKRA
jgi:hypothetical protein